MANMNDIKTLRNKTGAGFADCKKALDEANGDIAQAEKILKEMGFAAAAKRGGRKTGEGSIFINTNETHAVLLELRCETDFVARNEEFQKLGYALTCEILNNKLTSITELLQNKVIELIGTIKENMELARFTLIEKKQNEILAQYVHGKPGRLGAIVKLAVDDTSLIHNEQLAKFAHTCTLHAVAKTPLFLSPETVDDAYKNTQMEIFKTQVAQMGKPENIATGIVQGKWKKHLNEICFLLQPWVNNEKTTLQEELKTLSKEINDPVHVSAYTVFILGDE